MLETKEKFRTASWSLAEQGIVSLGSFLLNIQLARSLPASEYGTFALVFSCVFLVQQCAISLLFYPMCQRIAASPREPEAPLVSITMTLLAGGSLVASLLLGGITVLAGRGDIAALAAAFCAFWQIQDALRRYLVSAGQYSAAMRANIVSYGGQAVAAFVVAHRDTALLADALFWMTAACGAGVLVQLRELRLPAPSFAGMPDLVRDYWRVGLWGMSGGLLMLLRVQIFPWLLGLLHGTAATASLQAILNIGNLTNPLLFALCNTISLSSIKTKAHGNLTAWRASRFYMLIGAPFIIVYCAAVFAAPAAVLGLFYGPHSVYLADTLAVRIIMFSIVLNFMADTTSAFLYGIDGGRLSTVIALIGLAAAVLASVMVWPWGVYGAAVGMLAANLVRLVASYHYVGSMLNAAIPVDPPNSDVREARSDA